MKLNRSDGMESDDNDDENQNQSEIRGGQQKGGSRGGNKKGANKPKTPNRGTKKGVINETIEGGVNTSTPSFSSSSSVEIGVFTQQSEQSEVNRTAIGNNSEMLG